jgi:hypothetical protein
MDDNGMDYAQIPLFQKMPSNGDQVFEDPHRLREFILAGRAKITLQSIKTTKHYTYKIKRGDGELWFVHRLGPDNNYVYIGTIRGDKSFASTRKTPHKELGGEQLKIFNWFWFRLQSKDSMHPDLIVYHEGRCGMCGTELTDPESIKHGYGPDCRKKLFRNRQQLGG